MSIQTLGVELGIEWAEIVPVSSVGGDQVDLLGDLLIKLLPEGPPLYPDGELTDSPEEIIIAELIREAALRGRTRRAPALHRRRRRGDASA